VHIIRSCLLALALTVVSAATSLAEDSLRLGILKFGTVAWELDTIRHHGLDRAEGLNLQVTGFASKQAAAIAFQGGEVDAIVSDFIWVARQRAEQRNVTFAPYSATVGAIMVPADSPITTIADLKGRKIGVAGGPLDKSWLMLRAALKKQHGYDLADKAEAVFGAPPLLRNQFEQGGMDALVTFWHYAARLEAAGFRRLADMNDIATGMAGIHDVALVGYVFAPTLNAERREAAAKFLRASRAAKQIMLHDAQEWQRLRTLTKAKSDEELAELKRRFVAGIGTRFGEPEIQATQRLFAILAEIGGTRLTGRARVLDDTAFHPAARF